MRIERQVSDNSDKLDKLLMLERTGWSPSDPQSANSGKPYAISSRRTKEYLAGQLQKLSDLLETRQPPVHRVSLPVYPDILASNTHRPLLSDTTNGLRDAITTTQRILETYSRDSAGDTAFSLDHLSVALMDVGLAEQASEISSFSVRLYANIPALEFDSNFAVALRNHSNHLKALGQLEMAAEHARHAVTIYAHLPDVGFDPGRAGAFDSLAACLYALGKNEEALAASDNAVHISRDLLRRKLRDECLSADLAMFLSNRANTLHALNYQEDALKDASEAQKLYQALKRRSERYTPEYADSLCIYSQMLSTNRRFEQALPHAREAVSLLGQLDEDNADVYSPKLARALLCLFHVLNGLGRRLEAKDAIKRGVERFRSLAAQSPENFNPEYAHSLHSMGRFLIDHQRHGDAILYLDEAFSIYSFSNLGERIDERSSICQDKHLCLTRLKNYTGAVGISRHALDILKAAPTSQRIETKLAASRRHLAFALYNVSVERAHSPDTAVEPALEAVRRFRALLAAEPHDAEVRHTLVVASTSLSMFYTDLGRHAEALKYANVSVNVAEGSSLRDKGVVKKAWIRLSNCYHNKGHDKLATSATKEANRL
ncbi:hypothetical protein DFH06DRAFT_714075 [Mycena polygramma]|nr:hypothetical protein DFH06DRAFT_714075 [Mycena polygramma]